MPLVVAGKSYQMVATVANLSTQGGQGVGATLNVVPSGNVGEVVLVFSPTRGSIYLGPYAGGVQPFNFTVPAGTEGQVGRLDATVVSPTGLFLATVGEDLSVQGQVALVSFYFGLYYPPAGWDYWLPGWWDGSGEWKWDGRGWMPVTQMAWFQNVKPGPGALAFWLWRSDTATTSPLYEQYPQFVTVNNGEFWVYDFRTGTFYKS